ncbi:MAG: PA2779 family protein [Ramlibacter sp.]
MTSTLAGFRAVVATMLFALLATATAVSRAELMDAERTTQPQSQSELERAKVRDFLDRANVRERLQAMGVDGLAARDRVAAMTEEEVHALAQRIDMLPAGGALSQTDWMLILLVAILVVLIL